MIWEFAILSILWAFRLVLALLGFAIPGDWDDRLYIASAEFYEASVAVVGHFLTPYAAASVRLVLDFVLIYITVKFILAIYHRIRPLIPL